jgi:PAS domain S-box-containing protein
MAANTSGPHDSPADPIQSFLALADVLPEMLLLVSPAGEIRAANRAAAAEFGLTAREVPARTLADLCPAPGADEIRSYLRRCSGTRGPLPGTISCRAGGLTVTYRVDGALFRPAAPGGEALVVLRCVRKDQSVSRFVLLNRRVEELGQAVARSLRAEAEREDMLRREQAARVAAEAASRMKDDFLAMLSHELRTPLNAILGWTRILQVGDPDAARRARALDAIERNARAQTQLVEDLLDVSRIVAGQLRLECRPVPMARVVHAALDAVRPAAENKRIRLGADLDHRSLVVTGDEARLQQVVWNLLSNAVKFTPPDGAVSVRLDRTGAHARVVVADSGAGFAPEARPFLFRRFWQADQTSSRAHGGLGLGLAITRDLVEAHGGSVEAHSAGPGLGATFTVLLPVGPAAAQRATPAARTQTAELPQDPPRLRD